MITTFASDAVDLASSALGLEPRAVALAFVAIVHPLVTAALLVALLGSKRRNRRLSRRLGRIRSAAQIALRRARGSADGVGEGA